MCIFACISVSECADGSTSLGVLNVLSKCILMILLRCRGGVGGVARMVSGL